MEIMNYNVMSTPALVVNGKVEIKGRVPSQKRLSRYWLNIKRQFFKTNKSIK